MPTIQDNHAYFTEYSWPEAGDEWSKNWKGSATMWHASIYPRIHSFLPAGRALEIAPGYGRCTQYLVNQCASLAIVDLCQNCIDACMGKFSAHSNIEYHVNGGSSLEFLDDGSLDFVFSWDSLVHVEKDVIEGYLKELSRTMKDNAFGFIHHSNMAEFAGPDGKPTIENKHWRGESVSATSFREACSRAGLTCLVQEKVSWGDENLNDCFSVFQKASSPAAPLTVMENRRFMLEVLYAGEVLSPYNLIARQP